MPDVAGLPRSTYYYYTRKQKDPDKYAELKEEICSIVTEHKGRYGYRRVTQELQNRGFHHNHKLVMKLMKKLGLTSKVRMKKYRSVPFPVSWTVKMKKKQKETQDILSYHTQAAGCSDKARAKASGGRQPIEECGRTGL